ncbi:MAG: ATP-binding cassette domain-containing protein [Oceanospirillales bacterium]|nr:ATP-binding cassette domain-containing protein [Oceanospirillales bacterium]
MEKNINIENLVLSRAGKLVLKEINICIQPGRITALLGPNGAGKSSLVLAIAGLLPVDQGSIRYGDQELTNTPPQIIRQHGIAAVQEGHKVLSRLSVDDNFRATGCKLDKGELETEVERIYSIFPELKTKQKQMAGSLSGGQQQMVALGQALIGDPKIILADEMSLGLAPIVVTRLMDVLARVAEQGVGILLIEQFTEIALKIAESAYVMQRGRVCFSGTSQKVHENPSVLQEAYLS